ncbi:hypothetical protein M440DRAFT_1111683 [Trichoderma longibrachiatum ATCC 18648]|uniref:Uncharacterized protein n=1 Tax=Trichoderma longibrachiatum ATCC 18648 TaxID=983965 RepID=A0A2T4CEY9_TRILO|nr:hypothetical protein M440DRAFT_1111683 [Trichoderma longibrachiatum ATCC 18648]
MNTVAHGGISIEGGMERKSVRGRVNCDAGVSRAGRQTGLRAREEKRSECKEDGKRKGEDKYKRARKRERESDEFGCLSCLISGNMWRKEAVTKSRLTDARRKLLGGLGRA